MRAYRYGNLVFGIGIFFPGKIILFRCTRRAVTHPLGVVARQHKTNGGKKLHDHIRALIGQVLANAFGHGNRAALELHHYKSDAVDVQHQIRALVFDGHFLCNIKVILQRMLPINKLDSHLVLTGGLADLDAIAQLFVGLFVQVVEAHRLIAGGILQLLQGAADEHRRMPLAGQKFRQQFGLNIGVFSLGEIAQIGIPQFLGK